MTLIIKPIKTCLYGHLGKEKADTFHAVSQVLAGVLENASIQKVLSHSPSANIVEPTTGEHVHN